MPEITLKGHVVAVDDCDAHLLDSGWMLRSYRGGHLLYARQWRQSTEGKRRQLMLHHAILKPEAGFVVDHIDGNGLNNRRSNLRICTTQQNLWNQRKKQKTASRFKGVYRHSGRGKWGAQIRVSGKKYQRENHSLTQLQAALWYDEMAVRHFGEFAQLNFPERFHPRKDR